MNTNLMKQQAANAALAYITEGMIVGIGTGSTTNYFIDALASIKHKIAGTVASSLATTQRLQQHNIPVFDLNSIDELPIYIDGADEINHAFQMIKGGGGALTREKIIAANSKQFICIADQTKYVSKLGTFPLPIEVIPMARSYVARELVKLGGHPCYREGLVTDNGNIILDVWHLSILEPMQLEATINNIPGVVTNGLFALRPADLLILGDLHQAHILL